MEVDYYAYGDGGVCHGCGGDQNDCRECGGCLACYTPECDGCDRLCLECCGSTELLPVEDDQGRQRWVGDCCESRKAKGEGK